MSALCLRYVCVMSALCLRSLFDVCVLCLRSLYPRRRHLPNPGITVGCRFGQGAGRFRATVVASAQHAPVASGPARRRTDSSASLWHSHGRAHNGPPKKTWLPRSLPSSIGPCHPRRPTYTGQIRLRAQIRLLVTRSSPFRRRARNRCAAAAPHPPPLPAQSPLPRPP